MRGLCSPPNGPEPERSSMATRLGCVGGIMCYNNHKSDAFCNVTDAVQIYSRIHGRPVRQAALWPVGLVHASSRFIPS